MKKTRSELAYRRVLVKLSGEMLQGEQAFGIESQFLDKITTDIIELANLGVQVALVVGGGNFCRGAQLSTAGIDRVTGDQMGMLATMMNALAMADALERRGQATETFSALYIPGILDRFDHFRAQQALDNHKVVILAGGTGNPFFTTDTAASLRAVELSADILLKATKVDGVYSADPMQDVAATRYDRLSYDDVLEKQLRVMDLNAICLCRDNALPIRVFDLNKKDVLRRIVMGEDEGTAVGVS